MKHELQLVIITKGNKKYGAEWMARDEKYIYDKLDSTIEDWKSKGEIVSVALLIDFENKTSILLDPDNHFTLEL